MWGGETGFATPSASPPHGFPRFFKAKLFSQKTYNTLERNSFVRSSRGLLKSSFGFLSSRITPSSIKSTRSLTSLANHISWVTTSMVMPSFASSFITSRTSPTISGSRADVGSSNRSTWGFIASALAIATLCFCPPESFPG